MEIKITTLRCIYRLYIYSKHACDIIKLHSLLHHTGKYSQYSSIVWPVWLNGWVFVNQLSGCGFDSRCSHLTYRYCTWLQQGVTWYLGNYRVQIHAERVCDMMKTHSQKFLVCIYIYMLLIIKCIDESCAAIFANLFWKFIIYVTTSQKRF